MATVKDFADSALVSMESSVPTPVGLPPARYGFADLWLEADGTLRRGEGTVDLPADELAVLRLLLARGGEVVSPLELKRALFGETHVAGDPVAKCLASLRARLQPTDCIQTVYKRGHRISVAVYLDAAEPAGALPRLAILPVATGYGVQEYLGLGLFEQVFRMLNGERCTFASLMARDSVQTLARRGLDPCEIGEALQADLVLACTLTAMPQHSRLRAEMIRVEDGAQLWTEDMLAQRGQIAELAAKLASNLSSRMQAGGLSISASAAGADSPTSPPRSEANELYLRARHEWQSFERHRMQDAMRRLMHAIELDPTFTAARIDLAYLSVGQALLGFMPAMAAARMIHRAAETLPEGDEDGAALLPALGWTSFHVDRDLSAAARAFARSAHLAHEGWITPVRAMFALSRARFDEANDLLRAAIQLDPYAPGLHALLSWTLHLAGEADASVTQICKALAQFPEQDFVQLCGALILAFNGEAARSCKLALEVAARLPHFDLASAVHAYALACAGRKEQAHEMLERAQWLSRERFVLGTFHAAAYVALGEADAALEELRMANENRCPWFFQTLADPRLKPLSSHPEFEAMRGVLAVMEAEAAANPIN